MGGEFKIIRDGGTHDAMLNILLLTLFRIRAGIRQLTMLIPLRWQSHCQPEGLTLEANLHVYSITLL
jgi:hypothetical protein